MRPFTALACASLLLAPSRRRGARSGAGAGMALRRTGPPVVALAAPGLIFATPAAPAVFAPSRGRAEIAGYAPDDAKIYFRLHAPDDESPPRAYYFDLRGTRPGRAVRARSLEDPDTTFAADWSPPAWNAVQRRLAALAEERVFRFTCSVRAEAVGRDRAELAPQYRLSIDLEAAGAKARLELPAYCNTRVSVQGIHRIPGRRERLVVLTYSGSPLGCAELEQPVLLE